MALSTLCDQIEEEFRSSESELIELHRTLVQIPSVNRGDGSSANEDRVAAAAADYLKRYGVASHAVEGAPGRASLLASAGGGNRSLLFMSHSDVVPPGDAGEWRFPPFSAELADGRIWGRGSNDCKMLVACELFAMAKLARLGALQSGQLRVAVGADEEAGGRWGFGWLAEHESDFLRADLAVNEGGGAYLGRSASGERLFTLGCGEKGRYEIALAARGPGTHASVPWGRTNPIAVIGALAAKIAAWEGAPALGSPIFETLRERLGLAGPANLLNLDETIAASRKFSRSFAATLRAQSRATIVPTVAAGGEKSNAVPTSARLICDARILPTQSHADLERALEELLRGEAGVECKMDETAAPSVSAFAPETAALFERALERTFGGEGGPCRIVPTWCTGFTDSRFARLSGTPTFGFQVVEPRADADRLPIHCVDESIEANMLLPCALALGHLAAEFFEGSAAR